MNEYFERAEALKVLLNKEKIDPLHKALATNCLLVLDIELAKSAPPLTPESIVPQPQPDIEVQPAGVSQ